MTTAKPGASGFTGVTLKDHRDADNGNRTSDTPPDQGLCVGSGRVVEPVNTTFSIYSRSGGLLSGPTSLTVFFTGQHEIDRTVDPPTFGPFLTDPKCYYDPSAKRFVMTILELPFTPEGEFFNGRSDVLIAVSKSSTTTTSPGDWNFFALNVTDDGGPANITTNEFSILGPEFNGAQIYAISKSALFSGSLKYQAFHGAPIPLAEGPANSLQPATSPTVASWSTAKARAGRPIAPGSRTSS